MLFGRLLSDTEIVPYVLHAPCPGTSWAPAISQVNDTCPAIPT